MSTRISQKHIHEKILSPNPIPRNVKRIQTLDEYIKELLSDNKKLSTLNLKKKTLKGTQEKVASISGPLTRLRHIVEAKWKALPGTDDEATSGHIEIAALLKQNILL